MWIERLGHQRSLAFCRESVGKKPAKLYCARFVLKELLGLNLKVNTDLAALRNKRAQLKAEVEKKEDYTEHIERLRADLVNIDKELGVDKK